MDRIGSVLTSVIWAMTERYHGTKLDRNLYRTVMFVMFVARVACTVRYVVYDTSQTLIELSRVVAGLAACGPMVLILVVQPTSTSVPADVGDR